MSTLRWPPSPAAVANAVMPAGAPSATPGAATSTQAPVPAPAPIPVPVSVPAPVPVVFATHRERERERAFKERAVKAALRQKGEPVVRPRAKPRPGGDEASEPETDWEDVKTLQSMLRALQRKQGSRRKKR